MNIVRIGLATCLNIRRYEAGKREKRKEKREISHAGRSYVRDIVPKPSETGRNNEQIKAGNEKKDCNTGA